MVAVASRSGAVTQCVDEHWVGDDWASQDAIGVTLSKRAGSPRSAER